MAENYAFYYLNKAGELVTIVSMQCADDQVAMLTMQRFKPPSWASSEIWSGERCILHADGLAARQRILRTREPHPDH
jgi:hypothetical protein